LELREVRLPIRFPAVRRITVDDFSRCILPDKNGVQVLPRAEMPEPGGKAVDIPAFPIEIVKFTPVKNKK